MRLALEIARRARRRPQRAGRRAEAAARSRPTAARRTAVGAWRGAFLLAPYLRDTFVACGVLSETFETAITWDRFEDFHASAMEAARREGRRGLRRAGRGPRRAAGQLPLHPRLPRRRRRPTSRSWRRRCAAARSSSGTRSRRRPPRRVIEAGGTITHHHAVGRDHRPWYDRQRPAPFAAALRAAKAELDPAGMLNPGVLIDP